MPEAATGGVLWKKVLFKISQNSQETPVNFAKFLKTPYRTTLNNYFWNADIAKMKQEK